MQEVAFYSSLCTQSFQAKGSVISTSVITVVTNTKSSAEAMTGN